LAVTDWRLRRWRLRFLALLNAPLKEQESIGISRTNVLKYFFKIHSKQENKSFGFEIMRIMNNGNP